MMLVIATDLMVTGMFDAIAARHGKPLTRVAPSAVDGLNLPQSPKVVLIDLTAVADIDSLVTTLRDRFGTACQLVAFAPHVHIERIKAARQAGCDQVITRGQVQGVAEELMAG